MIPIQKILPEIVLKQLNGEYPAYIPKAYAKARYKAFNKKFSPTKSTEDITYIQFELANLKFTIGPCYKLTGVKR